MANNLKGKVAFVTGASSGFGAHFSKILAAEGAKVVLAARRKDYLDVVVAEIKSQGGEAMAIELDVTDASAVVKAFNAAEAAFGTVSILVNNAGISSMKHSLKDSEDDYDRMMNLNLKAVWQVATEGARRMVEAKIAGSIINISSIMGLNASPFLALYSTSKAAVAQLTKSLATELWHKGIRVNALCPGFFPTDINESFMATDAGKEYVRKMPAGRVGELEEISGPFLLLASDASSYMTGVLLPVDGGHTIRIA